MDLDAYALAICDLFVTYSPTHRQNQGYLTLPVELLMANVCVTTMANVCVTTMVNVCVTTTVNDSILIYVKKPLSFL